MIKIFNQYLELSLWTMAVVLAGNLLQLYFAGAWYDPIKWIEVSELVLLFMIMLAGIAKIICRLIKLHKEIRHEVSITRPRISPKVPRLR